MFPLNILSKFFGIKSKFQINYYKKDIKKIEIGIRNPTKKEKYFFIFFSKKFNKKITEKSININSNFS